MDAFGPAVPQFLLHGSARKGEPTFVEKCTGFVRTGNPNHDWRCVSHVSEALFGLVQRSFGALLTLGNIIDAQEDLLKSVKLTSAQH